MGNNRIEIVYTDELLELLESDQLFWMMPGY